MTSPYGEQPSVRLRQEEGSIGRDHLDAGFVGRGLELEPFPELGPHDALKRQHQTSEFLVETLMRQLVLHDQDDRPRRRSAR